jgi:N-methylhydantoinase A
VIAATYVAAQVGVPNVISFDMGGTTAKAGLVQNGRPTMASDFKVAALQGSVLRRGPGGGGFAIKTLVTDLAEVGVGGGSIAWLDHGEGIRVGPRSAGAQPGPAGYGRGGLEPTVTDADLLLGRVDPMFFAGGELRLDAASSERAFRERLGTPTGLAVADLAWGVVEIANQKMIQAIRAVSVERGYDPRDYALVAFGSAAPQHAAHIGQALEVPKVIVPSGPGCMSALGLLIAELRTDFTLTVMAELSTVDVTSVNAAIERSCREGDALISQDQSTNSKTNLAVSADLRYQGQSWELSVPVAGHPLTPAILHRLRRDFEAAHRTQYGYHLERGIVLLVAIRISVSKSQPRIAHARLPEGGRRPAEDAFKGTRDVMLQRQEGFRPTPVFDRARLATGNVIQGPALVEESQSTTVVPGGWRVEVDPNANLVLEPRSDA